MCGRIVNALSREDYKTYFALETTLELAPNYNGAPTNTFPVIRLTTAGKELMPMTWGFSGHEGKPLFNARSETVAEKVSFREAWRQRRGLFPCSGWYEWKDKQPYFVHRSDGKPIVLAALWEGERFILLTTQAGEDLGWLHHRVPVVLHSKHWEGWLKGERAEGWMKPFPAGPLVTRAANSRVGNVRNNDPSLLEAV